MAVDSYGAQGQPQFSASGADDQAADLTLLAEYARERGGLMRGTTAQRDAHSTAGNAAQGDWWDDTTLKQVFRWDGTTWRRRDATHAVRAYRSTAPEAVNPEAGIAVRTGIASGTTSAGGVMNVTFPSPFPTACIGVIPMPNQNRTQPGILVEGTVTEVGCQLLFSGAVSAARSIQYIAFGY